MRIVIAGAGLAGLTAAYELAGEGLVTVLDARARAGGRVWTVTLSQGGAGQAGELGGEFIEADHTDLRELADAVGVRLVRVLRGGFTHWSEDDGGDHRLSRTRPWDALADALAPLIRRYRAAAGESAAAVVREMATWSLDAYLGEQRAGRALHSIARALRGFFLADPGELSVLPVVEQIARGGSPAQAEMYRVVGGNGVLIDALVRQTPARFLLGHQVTAIHQSPERCVVHVTDAGGHAQQIEADAVVVTLPASTLRDVDIRPALPADQGRAIGALCYGAATKVLVQSRRPLFRDRQARAFATDTVLGAFWDGADGQVHDATGLVTFLGGGAASAALRRRAAGGGNRLLDDLCWLGMSGAAVADVQAVSWEDDPWARGGYAFIDPAFDPAWRPLLAQRAGRMVFAGEHTSERWQGYMNGAVESGRRAARELREIASQSGT